MVWSELRGFSNLAPFNSINTFHQLCLFPGTFLGQFIRKQVKKALFLAKNDSF